MNKGYFITLEGPDGSGKSSQKSSGTGKYAPRACAGWSGIDPFPALDEGTCR